ncbi:uncharacterized protein LOC127809331 [Diospyros lotus]|uniref:uncharacterized protein LOC127809331 n=1 Tax=Diospyros lotus TaxID=55363 RepID=UPI00224D0780|nr:uncharacterized protein LOC127809331 [Diospyros lotus]
MAKFVNSTRARMQSLETQIGQLAQAISEIPQEGLPSNTKKNPREHVKAITLRSGKELESKEKHEEHSKEEEIQELKAKENDHELSTEKKMSSYAKFLKDIIVSKRKLEEFVMMKLNEECSAILQNKLPPKLKDPGSFSVFMKLGLKEPTPTIVSLQLADRSIKYPRGVMEDVLVKVDKFIFPIDFIILDMEEDHDMPLILGRPFLTTGRALIDVQ